MTILESKLARLRGRLLSLWLLKSALAAGSFWIAVLAGLAVLDVVAGLPYTFRVSVSSVATVVAVFWFIREGFFSTVRATTDKGLALYVEKRHPEFRDALVTALQFSREGAGNPAFNSPALAHAVVAQAEEAAARIQEGEVLRARKSLRRGGVCGFFVAAVVVGAFTSPRFGTALLRTFRDTPFPRRTYYRIEFPLAPSVRVPRGENLLVRIVPETEGSFRPGRAAITRNFPGLPGRAPLREGMNRFENDAFTWECENVSENMTFVVQADDWESSPYRVDIVERPRLESLEIEVTPPAYAGLASHRIVARRRGGGPSAGSADLAALRGTRVDCDAAANKPLEKVALVFAGGNGETRTDAAVEERRFRGAFEIQEGGTYFFDILDRDGFSETQPARYQIRLVPDRPPETRITEPEEGTLDVTPFAIFEVRVRAEDDLGLASVRLTSSTTEADEKWLALHPFHAAEPPPKRDPVKKIEDFWTMSIEDLKLEPGILIRYRVEAQDFNTPTGTSLSQEYRCRIKTPTEVSQEVTRRLDDLRQEMQRTLEHQLEISQQASRVADLLAHVAQARQGLIGAALAQQGMADEINSRRQFLLRKIIWYFNINRLGEPAAGSSRMVQEEERRRKDLLERIDEKFSVLIETHVPAAASALVEAREAASFSEVDLQKAMAAQSRVAMEIQRILDDLYQVSEISTVINKLRRLRDQISKVAE